MTQTPTAVIFDLDGTLVDSARDLAAALNHVLKLAKRPEVDLIQVRCLVGDGARAMIKKGFSETGPLPDDATIDLILEEFLAYYLENITEKTIVFPGALSVIKKLTDRGIPLGLCTNKAIKLTNKLMTEIGLADYFSAIVGGDSFDYRKPDPRHLTSTLDLMGCTVKGAVMIGDSINDILAAKGADIPVICASFGYSQTPIGNLDPDGVFDHFDEFFKVLGETSEKFPG